MMRTRETGYICRITTVALVIGLLFSVAPSVSGASGADRSDTLNPTDSGYAEYIQQFEGAAYPEDAVALLMEQAVLDEGEATNTQQMDGKTGISVLSAEGETLTWTVSAVKAGFYFLEMQYLPVLDKASTIERALYINGSVPFENALHFTFNNNYINADVNEDTGFQKDGRDNQIRPTQQESPCWSSAMFGDYLGLYNEPYFFYLQEGENTISLEATMGTIWLHSLIFLQPDPVLPYELVAEEYAKKGYSVITNEPLIIQGEWATAKSDPMLYPTTDRSSPMTQPSSPTKIRLNTIGGTNWSSAGQSCTWTVNVKTAGLYALGIKYRQNLARGIWTNRKLSIDGVVPFEEAKTIRFNYKGNWQNMVFGDDQGNPYYIYLEPGEHTITLTATVGELTNVLETASESLAQLNYAYRQLLMVLGTSPDYYRDYQLEKQVPEALEILRSQVAVLESISKNLFDITGKRGTLTAIIDRLTVLVDTISEDPKLIQRRWSDLKSNISSFADWILDVQDQPLEIDYMMLLTDDITMPKANGNLFQNLWHELQALIGSFVEDYDSIGDVADTDQTVTVWVQSGRDQAQIIKNMVTNHFTAESGIPVNVQLVQGVLLQAVISGRAPDVCLNLSAGDPMNLALRGALVDLSKFDTYNEVVARFHESAMTPFRFDGATYAIPETQTFPMMFYRSDVLEELGIEPPNTWEELIRALPIIQRNNMDVGIDPGHFTTFLFQYGGDLYSENGDECIIDSETGINAFEAFTTLFLDYQLPLSFNFVNRFRTGEMPIGIVDYSTYNTLSVFAPEIRGLWEMVPIPGILQEDNTIKRTSTSGSSGCVILGNCPVNLRDNAWSFIDWWTSTETQKQYGKEMESLLGVAARYTSANVEAVNSLPWTQKDKAQLFRQWEWTQGTPEVPGSYFTGRHINNAFRQVVYHSEDPRDILSEYVEIINEEITSKRKEFGLSVKEK